MLDDAEGRLHFGRAFGSSTEGMEVVLAPAVRAPFERLAGILARQLWAILLPACLVPLLGFVAIERMPTLYTATGTVIYDPAGYTPDLLQSILKTDPTTDTVVASQAAILASQSVAHRVADALDLAQAPGFAPPLGLGPDGRVQALDAAVLKAIRVAPVDASRVFAVSFTARDPALAAAAVNRIMDFISTTSSL